MTVEQFEQQFANTKKVIVKREEARDYASIVVKAGLRKTKAEVKRIIGQKGLSVNGKVVAENEIKRLE